MDEEARRAIAGAIERNPIAELSFFAAVFAIAFVAGVSRAIRDDDYGTFGQCFCLGICSGSLGFCCVALALGPGHVPVGFDWFYLGLSALVGLVGKEQDRLIRFLLSRIFKAVGIDDSPVLEDEPLEGEDVEPGQ